MTKATPLPEFSIQHRQKAIQWLSEQKANIPSEIAAAINLSIELSKKFADSEQARRSVLYQLRKALGILPSSERKNCDSPLKGLPKGKKSKRRDKADLNEVRDRSLRLRDWHRQQAKKQDQKAKKTSKVLMELDEIEFTQEEKEQFAKESRECQERMELGARCDLDCAAPSEKIMAGASIELKRSEIVCPVGDDEIPPKAEVLQRFSEKRRRISCSLALTQVDIIVEKVAIQTPKGQTLMTGTTEEIGPANSKITWEFLTNMTILVSQYAMPLNRFANLVSSPMKKFTGGEMSRYFRYVARRLAPVYLVFARQIANSRVFTGDDTSGLVLEVSRTFQKLEKDPETVLPWSAYATAEKAQETLKDPKYEGLGALLAAELGFEFPRKKGDGMKSSFNTSVISGRSEPFEPKSTVIFFRSHFGGFGNLLDTILQKRSSDHSDVVIQSDLSTVNLISDSDLIKWLKIKLSGCASHARRSFAQYENDDPEHCSQILHLFKGLFIFEEGLDIEGRNEENTLAVRSKDIRPIWEQIQEVSKTIAKRWSGASKLGEAARYIIRHYEALTYYLEDHRLGPTNNFSERMLRPERLIENNALFRQTLEGRFALDIVRTVLQTGIAASIDLQLYLQWLLSMPDEIVRSRAEEFTPLAFSRLMTKMGGLS